MFIQIREYLLKAKIIVKTEFNYPHIVIPSLLGHPTEWIPCQELFTKVLKLKGHYDDLNAASSIHKYAHYVII